MESEIDALKAIVANDPKAGDLIKGTGGARKLRMKGRGKGKSGGFRVITYYGGEDVPIFLLNVFGKGQKASLSDAECNELKDILGRIAAEYRKSTAAFVARKGERK